jgi:hypothetical protein
MKKTIPLFLIIFFTILSVKCWSQTDSLETHSIKQTLLYLGLGGGFNSRGGNFDINFTVSSSKGLGGSINFITGFIQLKDVPSDYYEGFLRDLTPAHRFTSVSLNLVAKLSAHSGSFRMGFEAGPSWTSYNLIELKDNPEWPNPFEYKYNKIHTFKKAAGLFLAMKADFPTFRFVGCDLSFFGIINNVKPVIGLDLCIDLGRVKKRIK